MIYYSIIIFLASIVLILLTIYSVKSPKISILSIFIAFLIDTTFQGVPPALTLLGLSMYPADLILGIIGIAGGFRWLIHSKGKGSFIVLCLVLVLTLSIIRGAEEYTLSTVLNSGRPWTYVLATLIYCSTVDWTKDRLVWLRITWNIFALIILCIGIIWFFLNDLGIVTYSIYQGTFRFLPASGALFLAQAALLGLIAPTLRSSQRILPIIFLLAVIFLQHRTVWICTLMCFFTLPILDRQRSGRLLLVLSSIGIFTVIATPLILPQLFFESLEQSATSSNTFLWRLDGWSQLLSPEKFSNPVDFIFGQPMGSGYERIVDGEVIIASPHNIYIQALLDIGLLGLLSYISIIIVSLKRRFSEVSGMGTALSMVVISTIVYGGSYFTIYPSIIVLGIGISNLISKTSREYDLERRDSLKKDSV